MIEKNPVVANHTQHTNNMGKDAPISLGLIAVVVFFAASGVISYINTRVLSEDAKLVTHTHKIIATMSELMSYMKDAEPYIQVQPPANRRSHQHNEDGTEDDLFAVRMRNHNSPTRLFCALALQLISTVTEGHYRGNSPNHGCKARWVLRR